MDIIYAHGCTWRYELNAIKSVLVLGESKTEHTCDAKDRIFKPGPSRVKERTSYEHVGMLNSIFDYDYSGIEERISEGRRVSMLWQELAFVKVD